MFCTINVITKVKAHYALAQRGQRQEKRAQAKTLAVLMPRVLDGRTARMDALPVEAEVVELFDVELAAAAPARVIRGVDKAVTDDLLAETHCQKRAVRRGALRDSRWWPVPTSSSHARTLCGS